MSRSFFSRLFHQFMAGRLRAEMPGADDEAIRSIVCQHEQRAAQPERQPVRNPFRLGAAASDWRLETSRVGAL